MDLKDKLKGLTDSLEIKRLDQRLIIVLAVLGLAMIALTIWLSFGDWRSSQDSADSKVEVEQALSQLAVPVQKLNRVMFDEQVQALALRAIKAPDSLDDLLSYLKGHIPEISGVQVFNDDLEAIDGAALGANGYALLDALLALHVAGGFNIE